MTDTASKSEDRTESLHRVVVRFAGDSGDGMQLTGDRFTSASAMFGNDLSTLPEFPAEIRAPAGTVHGVSSFQVHISDHDITTPGDAPNVLVAMNPAALHADLNRLESGGMVILNSDAFDERNLSKAGYANDPRADKTLAGYKVIEVPMTSLTLLATEPLGVKSRDAERSKNFFALGLISWLYSRLPRSRWRGSPSASVRTRWSPPPTAALLAGHAFGETTEQFDHPTRSTRQSRRPVNTRTSPATPRWRGASSPPGSSRTCRSCWAAIRSPLRATSSTSWRNTRTSACARSRPKTK
jgi:2-oxoglutarate ferredoxin oxidoreductase subunit alpha